MGLLLGLLFLGHLTVVTYGHPILEAPESVTGPWKGDVNIPCTYGPLQGYTQVMVKWLVQRGWDPVTIFLRDSSGDHIQLAKYRGRLQVNHEVPGDVSLQLNTLEMDDRSHYTCEVTWQTPSGNQVVRDKIIDLRIQKVSVSKPTVTTGSGYGFTVPQGMRISLQCQAWGSPPISYVWYKEQTNNQEPIKVAVLSTLLFKHAMVADSGSYFCAAKGRVGSEQRSNIVKFVVKDSSKPLKTKTEAPTTMQSPLEGKGLPVFSIVLIISLCCIVVFIMAYVMVCRKTSQQEHVYEVARIHTRQARNSGENWRVAIFTSGCSSEEPSSQTPGNDYSDDTCLGQEYQIITQINSDYTHLLHTVSPDYELLATKDERVC
ncbi:V-set and immunoglobulin domain-containing protein 4 isoform X4 [Canis lupus baileyi]|uniref:V-set and immunoglobulin domain containing 4 n=3 Tax=Canis lupus TaxID=9612 RepID=A0A8C0TD92_CANLF|nr:V-set and immunoglobulin domain-containing protein 4 isoform X4 [Canis lupus familiaris]XP_025321846.1 V-set and immunoglobulin domain-containing protein 4 isoform X4 [Canis lupus dingo]XP_038306099.1 V-set and immunoglobulin domain-containing protein 4 isoform X4 [Canis lupus familiaris]XP_038443515.1 V-set and immunoglobulin domain-containing protein 4 isoform X4 [Canis lupus familiaris]|eukprot:XP_022271715.1 V-set and immunoglobulin domain-containing protein 4 isoform X4 [Canis lupus familiaris]